MGAGVYKRYIRNLGALQDELSRWATRTQSDYISIPTDTEVITAVLGKMRGVVLR